MVEDHQLFREGVKLILNNSSEFEVVAEFENGKELVEHLQNLECEVGLMDITKPEMDGIEATDITMKRRPELSIFNQTLITPNGRLYSNCR